MSVPARLVRPVGSAMLGLSMLAAGGCFFGGKSDPYERPNAVARADAAGYDADRLRAGGSTSPHEFDAANDEYIGDAGAKPKRRRFGRRDKKADPDQAAYQPTGSGADDPYETRPPAAYGNEYAGGVPSNAGYGGGYGGEFNPAPTPVNPAPAPMPTVAGFNGDGIGINMDGGAVSPIQGAPAGGTYSPNYGAAAPMPYAPVTPGGPVAASPTPTVPPSYNAPAPAVTAPRPDFDRAKELVRAQRYAEARVLLERELATRATDADVWLWYGDCLYNMLQLSPAMEAYDRALSLDGTLYLARRGQGFAALHLGHEYWARQTAARQAGDVDGAERAFAEAHGHYKKAIENLRDCVKVDPKDDEASYGRAMAAEGFSRRLYALTLTWLRAAERAANPAEAERAREAAQSFASQCAEIIRADGLEPAQVRINADRKDSGPRALQGGLFLRLAMLNHHLGKESLATQNLRQAIAVQEGILRDVGENNPTARAAIAECERYLSGQWPAAGAL